MVVGVNVQDSIDDSEEFVDQFGLTYPSVRDTDLKLWAEMGVRGLPETFFVRSRLPIRKHRRHRSDWKSGRDKDTWGDSSRDS